MMEFDIQISYHNQSGLPYIFNIITLDSIK